MIVLNKVRVSEQRNISCYEDVPLHPQDITLHGTINRPVSIVLDVMWWLLQRKETNVF